MVKLKISQLNQIEEDQNPQKNLYEQDPVSLVNIKNNDKNTFTLVEKKQKGL